MVGIYLHIPYCRKACTYCDFHFSTQWSTKQAMLGAMMKEIDLRKAECKHERVQTIYFGGGTPSALESAEVEMLLHSIRQSFRIDSAAEITFEVNPEALSLSYLSALKNQGINRLSIGVQTFRDEILKLLNRSHNAEQVVTGIKNARIAGFDNISIDLIYGLPGSTLSTIGEDLEKALSLRPQHVSAYALTVEPRTALNHQIQKEILSLPNEESVSVQFIHLCDTLESAGFEHYELSNFSLPGYHSKHNQSYWSGSKYLGIGPSAHSFDGSTRRWNLSNNPQYIAALNSGKKWHEEEILTLRDRYNEYLMTGLRTAKGISTFEVEEKFGSKSCSALIKGLSPYITSGHVLHRDDRFFLTRKGYLISNSIISDLFEVE